MTNCRETVLECNTYSVALRWGTILIPTVLYTQTSACLRIKCAPDEAKKKEKLSFLHRRAYDSVEKNHSATVAVKHENAKCANKYVHCTFAMLHTYNSLRNETKEWIPRNNIWMSGALHGFLSSSPSRTEPLRLVADTFYRLMSVQRIHFTHVMHML